MDGTNYLPRARAHTEYPVRPHHGLAQIQTGSQNTMPHYQPAPGYSHMAGTSYMQYSPVTTSYSSYSPNYFHSSNSPQAAPYIPHTSSNTMPYSVRPPPRSATLPSQHRIMSRSPYCSSSQSQHSPHLLRTSIPLDFSLIDTEDQDSVNRDTKLSEPVDPPLQGYPSVEEFDKLMQHYVAQLSPKKQDKALIHASRATNIRTVLIDKKTTSVESAQFRFWVKKMFQLQPSDPSVPMSRRKICHEGKPVAIREKLFKILTRAHQKCQHGGRDKTSAQVRRVYSWVPKELISRFVKLCPTCQIRRGMNRNQSPSPDQDSPFDFATSEKCDEMFSPRKRRRESTLSSSHSNGIDNVQGQLMGGSPTFRSQNRWMSDFQAQQTAYDGTMYSTNAAGLQSSSFSTINGMGGYDGQTQSHPHHNSIPSGSSGPAAAHSRSMSSNGALFKEEVKYNYD